MADFKYRLDKRLIIIPAFIQGAQNRYNFHLILDTGASLTTLDPFVLMAFQFSEFDYLGPSTVRSPVGKEKGFRIRIADFQCLGKRVGALEIACHPLGLQHVDGLLGMNFLENFDFCIYPQQNLIHI